MNTSLKVVLVTCGLIGNISYNSGVETDYLEDDALFGKVSEQQDLGWSWGLSKAHAICIGTGRCVDESEGDTEDPYVLCLEWAQTQEEREFCDRFL